MFQLTQYVLWKNSYVLSNRIRCSANSSPTIPLDVFRHLLFNLLLSGLKLTAWPRVSNFGGTPEKFEKRLEEEIAASGAGLSTKDSAQRLLVELYNGRSEELS